LNSMINLTNGLVVYICGSITILEL